MRRTATGRAPLKGKKSEEGDRRNEQEPVVEGPIRARARASALASALRIRNHGPRATAASQRPRTPGSASHGDEWIDHARALTAGTSAARSRGGVQRRFLRPARPLRSGARGAAVHPDERSTSGRSATASTMSAWSSPSSSPTRCGTHCPSDTPRPERPRAARTAALDAVDRRVWCARYAIPATPVPVARESEDCSAESGRGLFLVDSFADTWGWHPLAGTLTARSCGRCSGCRSGPSATPCD